MKSRNFVILTLSLTVLLLLGFVGMNVYVDPLFHYHAPSQSFEYPLWDERYMNDGITRHFTYDAILTGSSMTENFRTSQWDAYFGTHSIKIPFSGGTYKEVGDAIRKAFAYNPDIKYVMRSLDSTMLVADADSLDYNDYPNFLYDSNPLNDVNYVLNKDLYLKYTEYVFTFNRLGGVSSTFDVYKNWGRGETYNGEQLKNSYTRVIPVEEERLFLKEDQDRMLENLEQNVLSLAKEHPDTQFYLFDPPYSILAFDDYNRNGMLGYMLDAWELEVEALLSYDNIRFFAFYDAPEVITNLDYYRDSLHDGQVISDFILECMASGAHEITRDNSDAYFSAIRDFYLHYSYDSIWDS